MTRKIKLLKLKIINLFNLSKLFFVTKYYGFCYILFILISLLLSKNISYFICLNDDILINYKSLYTNTGIAFIGLAGIIFTLQIFNQEIKNNYMNSVMEKILDIKFQHIVQYIYITIIICLFLFLPNINYFANNLNFFIPFYYSTIIIIFAMFGIDLFISTNKSNKLMIIKTIENRIDFILNFVEKEYQIFEKYSVKEKVYNPPLIDYISKMNNIFIGYVQCINYILRNSIDDPILFSNGMETYNNIVKNRLSRRKNTFNYNFIPFLSDVLPNKDNDNFIEKYILEYLDEYAKIAVNKKNRDILSIVQHTYYSILIIGKDNRYVNNNGLELTIKVIFSYYLKTIKYIVEFDNDNLLFETIEIFKEIFIKNSEYFNELIDIMFIDDIKEINSLSLEKKSLMNYRNIQGLIVIPFYSILNSKDKNKRYRLELLFDCLKNNLIIFTTTKNLIRRKDEARTYLNYMFNTLEFFSYYKFLLDYFNSNIDTTGNFIDNTRYDDNLLKPFVDFFNDDLVINCLTIMNSDNRYVTGVVCAKQNISLLSQFLIKLIYSEQFKHIKNNNILLLKKCFNSIKKYSSICSSNGMKCYEIHNFFEELLNSCKYQIENNDEISNLVFNEYYNCLINSFDINGQNKNFEIFYEYINCIYNMNLSENYVYKLIDWYINLDDNSLNNLFNIYTNLINRPFINDRNLSYDNIEKLKKIIIIKIELILNETNNKKINELIKNKKYDIKTSLRKKQKIELILEMTKKR